MPGIDLNLDLPELTDTYAEALAKTATALSAIEVDLAGLVTAGVLNINSTLSMGGQRVENVGGLHLDGGTSTVPGTLYMDEELWVMTDAGAVQITNAGALDVASLGTIGGDYGSGDEAVTYDAASTEYRFKSDASTWAFIKAAELVLTNGTGSVRFKVDPAITTARTFSIKELPASGISALVYDASTSTVELAENSRTTNDVKVTTLSASTSVTLTGALSTLKHGDQEICFGWDFSGVSDGGIVSTSFSVGTNYAKGVIDTGATYYRPIPLHVGARLKKLRVVGFGGSNAAIGVYKQAGGFSSALPDFTRTGNTVTDGYGELTFDTPYTLVAGDAIFVHITANPGGTQDVDAIRVFFDTP